MIYTKFKRYTSVEEIYSHFYRNYKNLKYSFFQGAEYKYYLSKAVYISIGKVNDNGQMAFSVINGNEPIDLQLGARTNLSIIRCELCDLKSYLNETFLFLKKYILN